MKMLPPAEILLKYDIPGMSEQIYPGPSQMTRIDGDKVRSLREAKGLTQLYIATVVGVTTDTISRWENKRYPSVKEENARKLAEASSSSMWGLRSIRT